MARRGWSNDGRRGLDSARQVDVLVARTLDLKRCGAVEDALYKLEYENSGLITPLSTGKIILPILGGPVLKRAMLSEKSKKGRRSRDTGDSLISYDKMQAVGHELQSLYRADDLTLRVRDRQKPFYVNSHDQLVVPLKDDSRQLRRDKKGILVAIKEIIGPVSQDEIDATEYFKPPEIVIGKINRPALGIGAGLDKELMDDPNTLLLERIETSRRQREEKEEEIRYALLLEGIEANPFQEDESSEIRLFAPKVAFGGLRIIAQERKPDSAFFAQVDERAEISTLAS